MKRTTTLLSAAVLGILTTGFSSPLAASDSYKVTGVSANDTLNLRSAPRASSTDIGDVYPGQNLEVVGYDETGKWAVVILNGQQAFVSMRFLTLLSSGPATAARLGMNQVTGISPTDSDGGLVVRKGPGTSHAKLLVVPNGVSFKVVEISADGKWSRAIFSDGGTGWLRNRFLRPNPTAGASTPPPPTNNANFPAVYSVSNVPSGQVLWVRNAPSATSAPVTNLASNGIVSVLEILGNGWAKVTVGQNIGYVNASFLTQGGGTLTASGMQLGLTCAGTEPFWALDIATDGTTSFEALGGSGPVVSSLQSATPMSGGIYPVQFTTTSQINGVISAQICSDGMSDISYPWMILLNAPVNGSMQTVSGCCTLQ